MLKKTALFLQDGFPEGSIAVTNKNTHLTCIFIQDGRLEVTIWGDQPPDKLIKVI